MEARTKAARAEYRGLLWGGGGGPAPVPAVLFPSPHPTERAATLLADAEAGTGERSTGAGDGWGSAPHRSGKQGSGLIGELGTQAGCPPGRWDQGRTGQGGGGLILKCQLQGADKVGKERGLSKGPGAPRGSRGSVRGREVSEGGRAQILGLGA